MGKSLGKMKVDELVEYGESLDPQILFDEGTTKKEMVQDIGQHLEMIENANLLANPGAIEKPVDNPIVGPLKELIEMTNPLNPARNYISKQDSLYRKSLNDKIRAILEQVESEG